MKKIIATLLSLVMLLGLANISVFSESENIELPSATVTELDVTEIQDIDLTFAMNFLADSATEERLTAYGDWYADFVLTVNKDVTFNADGTKDGYLAGQYDEWSTEWIKVPFEDKTVLAYESLKIMETASQMMGKESLKYTYADVYEGVKDFDCGVYFTDEFLAANPDLAVTLELLIFNPEDENESYTIGENYEFLVTPLPTATATKLNVTDVKDVDLTFAMNFNADDAEEEQLAAYGKYYADFFLTVNKDVTFNADGTKDGYLAGQYDEWSESWVSVPFEDKTVLANEPIMIMSTAAQMMGKEGLRYTYDEAYDVVKDFDCGVYFTDAFLEENPDLEVTLELALISPDDMYGYTIIKEEFKITKTKTEDNVELKADTVEDKVVIFDLDITEVPEETETISIDLAELAGEDTDVQSVQIPASAIDEISETKALELKLSDNSSIVLDQTALQEISAQTQGASFWTINLSSLETEDLETDQKQTVKTLPNSAVYEISVATENGAADLQNGTITVNIPYDDKNADKVIVKKLSDDGTTQEISSTYVNGVVSFTMDSSADFVIYTYTEPTYSSSGGGNVSDSSLYTVKFNTNGGSKIATVKVKRNTALEEPEAPVKAGYTFGGWYEDVALTKKYDFDTNVRNSFTLYAKWVGNGEQAGTDVPVEEDKLFSDVKSGDWYYDSVEYVVENGIMNGETASLFAPNGTLTRAMLATIIYRAEGEPEVGGESKFYDIQDGSYYEKAIIWAEQNGIVKGYSDTQFVPNQNIIREQMAAIMHRYAEFKSYDVSVGENTNILSYDDFNMISEYAIPSIQYAVGSGLIKGNTASTINPKGNLTRAEMATILYRFIEANN